VPKRILGLADASRPRNYWLIISLMERYTLVSKFDCDNDFRTGSSRLLGLLYFLSIMCRWTVRTNIPRIGSSPTCFRPTLSFAIERLGSRSEKRSRGYISKLCLPRFMLKSAWIGLRHRLLQLTACNYVFCTLLSIAPRPSSSDATRRAT
jgi:hypothetical protein